MSEIYDKYVGKIEDNGVGFDTTNINTKRVGINNTIERFKLILDASVDISSTIGKGTLIKIKIKR
jgi:signal transduction histidine kinase